MQIRRFCPEDAPALAFIFHAAVHSIAGLHYSAEQVAAWAPAVPAVEDYLKRDEDGRLILVAVDDMDRPVAYGDLEEDGHIDHLYCHPNLAGSGVTSILYENIEAAAIERDLERLFVEASEPARRFFLKRGFVLLQRREFKLEDVQIYNFEMEKRLSRP